MVGWRLIWGLSIIRGFFSPQVSDRGRCVFPALPGWTLAMASISPAEPGWKESYFRKIHAIPHILRLLVMVCVSCAGCEKHSTQLSPVTSLAHANAKGKLLLFDIQERKMKIFTEEIGPDKYQMTFENAPAFLTALEWAPAKRDSVLDDGE